jgi:hypothetical protein
MRYNFTYKRVNFCMNLTTFPRLLALWLITTGYSCNQRPAYFRLERINAITLLWECHKCIKNAGKYKITRSNKLDSDA